LASVVGYSITSQKLTLTGTAQLLNDSVYVDNGASGGIDKSAATSRKFVFAIQVNIEIN
jgi:hypothetical protein